MENKNTNFDILELLSQENNNDLSVLLSTNEIIEVDTKTNDVLNDFDTTNIEIKSDIIQEIISDNSIQNNNIDILNNENIIQEIETKNINKKSLLNKIINNIVFLFKYLATSSLIFVFLLSITNYSAYIEIARSYLNPEILEQNKQNLLSSINGANINLDDNSKNINESINENIKNDNSKNIEDDIKKETIGEKISIVKNKTYHSMNKLLNDRYDNKLNMQIEIVPYENRIIIPKIGKNVPLVEVKNKTVQNVKELEDVFMDELKNGVVRYPGTARPGEVGNSFIFGHSSNFPWIKSDYNDVFALLDNVVFGDEIITYYNQKKYIYKVKEKKIVKPGDVSILKRNTKKAEISLMTCWPVGTTLNRIIVIGELVE